MQKNKGWGSPSMKRGGKVKKDEFSAPLNEPARTLQLFLCRMECT